MADIRRAKTSMVVAGRTILPGESCDFESMTHGKVFADLVKAEWFERLTAGADTQSPPPALADSDDDEGEI